MPLLPNPQYEAFAQLVATGVDSPLAYAALYPGSKGRSSKTCGPRLLRKVVARVRELQAAAATAAMLTIREKRLLYADAARTPVGDIDEKHPLCQSVKRTFGAKGELRSVEYKILDKLRATELDSALDPETLELQKAAQNPMTVNVAVAVMTETRRAELLEKKRQAIQRRVHTLPASNGNGNGNGNNGNGQH